MPSSFESASNWDFTPVINLLRTPTYGTGSSSVPYRHPESASIVRPTWETNNNDGSASSADVREVRPGEGVPPKLGDFGSLWELLGSTSISASRPPVEPCELQRNTPTPTPQSPKRIEILKRPLDDPVDSAGLDEEPSRTPSKPIPVSRSRNLQAKATAGKRAPNKSDVALSKHVDEASTSESAVEAESDGNLSVFDPPLLKSGSTPSLVPPQVGTAGAMSDPYETPPSSYDESMEASPPKIVKNPPNTGTLRVQPIAYRSTADRRIGLLTKLLKNFPDYADAVTQVGRPLNSKKTDVTRRPIHVFVDMSNIMVGFHDTVKLSRKIPVKTRIRRLPLSFQNFSLILERGRPTAKRVLVGSDRFAAITEGEQLGYEANILDRVHKVKHMTPRQMRFRKNPRAGAHDPGSGSETNEASEERWVEQGVDEILHLKILESLLDTDEPATIVLATGDAAEAEFSGGFMKMVERALSRGWAVELVSFSQVTSYAYRRKEFRAKWGNRFRMIALDEYIEELLDM
ncbi:NYN domain-containing protein [Aspergillus luchuensis]|uniref:NYN domain-containing protein n=2 Tax=Aspergillus kawachii TaxID=1069201 RepID=A0A1M3T3F6_ASPLC|nr:uncharacterized protein AKAW2_51896S [Aspergillus luchuensis]OJZ81233.1 hypothetical protein ASPFODRAFT_145889 [Aspergillus luchuensis CBS 106.47]GAA87981.1 similar to An06g01600 [Aspergillus luchuensis IFO 4308]BCS01555.1 hypothetical protein AKAW2_51896S [Aspergillus luchuensis]BCS13271.1 hypothetical protein ALUC_51317S [Aspergillus luchuensis]GAT22778.1 similar to An06g01600 [Aspergillus luchuensis]